MLHYLDRLKYHLQAHPKDFLLYLFNKNIGCILSDRSFLSINFRVKLGKKLRLSKPSTYNEKLQWLKLNDRNPLYTHLVDKYEVRKYVADKIGEKYLVPMIGVWESIDDINFDILPEAFVLKTTHDSGGVVICRDKKTFDIQYAKIKLRKSMKRNFYYHAREWPYKDVKPRIICEELIKTKDNKPPKDYKILCFNGVPKIAFVASDRGENTKFDFFTTEWERLSLKQHYPNSEYELCKPVCWKEMLYLSEQLSKNIPHVRVDFYIDSIGNILFGELTFFHFSGFEKFEPEMFDSILGDWIDLKQICYSQGLKQTRET